MHQCINAVIFSLSWHMNGFLEPHTAYERQWGIDYFDLLLIVDFDWLVSSLTALADARKNHSLSQPNYWILKRWKQHCFAYAVISHKPVSGIDIQMSCSCDKDECQNRKINRISRMNILSIKTSTKHGACYNRLLTILRYRAKTTLFIVIWYWHFVKLFCEYIW